MIYKNDNILIVIDAWDGLNNPLERDIKRNIVTFLKTIRGCVNWKIYHYHTDDAIDTSLVDELQHHGNAVLTNDPMVIYDHNVRVKYYYCGFHTNKCMFYNHIGIEKMMEISPDKTYEYFIIYEMTGAMYNDNTVMLDDLPLNAHNCIDNYRTEILRNHMIKIKSIIL